MTIKRITGLFFTFLISHHIDAMVLPHTPLSQYPYKAASLLPLTSWGTGPKWALLSEEAHGSDKGTFDDFGGKRDSGEIHPLITASREAWEESIELLMSSEKELRDYIDLKKNNTESVIISIDKSMVTYITNFNHNDLENVTKKFYSKLQQTTQRKFKEKSRLAWVNYDQLKKVIANTARDSKGALITPIIITANIVNPTNPSLKGQIKNQHIHLRPVFVSKLQEYFKGSDYIEGKDLRIKFFKRGYKKTQNSTPIKQISTLPKPITRSTQEITTNNLTNLTILTSRLNSLCSKNNFKNR